MQSIGQWRSATLLRETCASRGPKLLEKTARRHRLHSVHTVCPARRLRVCASIAGAGRATAGVTHALLSGLLAAAPPSKVASPSAALVAAALVVTSDARCADFWAQVDAHAVLTRHQRRTTRAPLLSGRCRAHKLTNVLRRHTSCPPLLSGGALIAAGSVAWAAASYIFSVRSEADSAPQVTRFVLMGASHCHAGDLRRTTSRWSGQPPSKRRVRPSEMRLLRAGRCRSSSSTDFARATCVQRGEDRRTHISLPPPPRLPASAYCCGTTHVSLPLSSSLAGDDEAMVRAASLGSRMRRRFVVCRSRAPCSLCVTQGVFLKLALLSTIHKPPCQTRPARAASSAVTSLMPLPFCATRLQTRHWWVLPAAAAATACLSDFLVCFPSSAGAVRASIPTRRRTTKIRGRAACAEIWPCSVFCRRSLRPRGDCLAGSTWAEPQPGRPRWSCNEPWRTRRSRLCTGARTTALGRRACQPRRKTPLLSRSCRPDSHGCPPPCRRRTPTPRRRSRAAPASGARTSCSSGSWRRRSPARARRWRRRRRWFSTRRPRSPAGPSSPSVRWAHAGAHPPACPAPPQLRKLLLRAVNPSILGTTANRRVATREHPRSEPLPARRGCSAGTTRRSGVRRRRRGLHRRLAAGFPVIPPRVS